MRRRMRILQISIFFLVLVHFTYQARKLKTPVITDVDNIKEFKKLLRTKTNVLFMFVNSPKSAKVEIAAFKETAEIMKGQATLVLVECGSGESKKLCKKLKIDPNIVYSYKHYKDGEFHKDYDRSPSVNSLTNFLRDPTGELPWDEAPDATDIYHLKDSEALSKFLRKSAAAYTKSLILFYAPWCGYCKTLKPEYVKAAGDLKEEALLAAIDVSKPYNIKVRHMYNISGFPTILYFEKGNFRFPYIGENKRLSIVDFMRNPTAPVKPKIEETLDSWPEDSDVVHLTDENFQSVLAKEKHALVIFYAPWCGHCKNIKPEFDRAASAIKRDGVNGILAAVDSTKYSDLAKSFGVKAYPTLKYFSNGQYQYDAGHARKEQQIIDFIKDPQEPPPPPPPEKPWSEEESQVRHLGEANFKTTLRKFKHAIVMFYAPWCGHCKSTKPEFVKAAERFADELIVLFAAVDCTAADDLCHSYGIRGYPTIKYFSYYDRVLSDYTGGRKEEDFVAFINNKMGSKDEL